MLKIMKILNVLLHIYFTILVIVKEGMTKTLQSRWHGQNLMCPGKDVTLLTDTDLPWGIPHRAYISVPAEIEIAKSYIPKAGMGTIARTFVPKYTWLVEYEGITLLPQQENQISWYAWTIYKGGNVLKYIDGGRVETSNWSRFINTATNIFNVNVWSMQCYDRLYYMTIKDVYPGQELLTDYGEDYAHALQKDKEYALSSVVHDIELSSVDDKDLLNMSQEIKMLLGNGEDNLSQAVKDKLQDKNSYIRKHILPLLNDEQLSKLSLL